jgi:chromate transporter
MIVTQDAEELQEPQNTVSYTSLTPQQQRQRLTELATVFLRLGTLAFGGPAAHVAMMEQEIVSRRHWMSREQLLDLLGITNLIPGPNSTELAIHIGYERAGWRGLAIAGIAFILPAMLIVWILAAIYTQYQMVPQVEWLLYGIKPVIIAIVVQALWKLGRKAVKNVPTGMASLGAIVAYFLGLNEVMVLLFFGVAIMLTRWQSSRFSGALLLPLVSLAQAPAAIAPVGWSQVFWLFLKIGSVLYGGGYVLLAFLQRDLVERNQWLTSQQLLDAVAIGQLTPGPLFTTATFIGYLVAGNGGAIAATVGIFLPAFLLVWIVNPWVPKLRQSEKFSGFLDGVNAAALGLMAGVTFTLGRSALVDGLSIVLAILGAIGVFCFQINSAWLVLGGGAIGLLAHGLGLTP